jgi:hypothetical protein
MAKYCPPGVFCIENYTIFTIFCILIVALASIFMRNPNNRVIEKDKVMEINHMDTMMSSPFVRANPRFSYNDNSGDILLNPYSPPVNDERYIIPSRDLRNQSLGLGAGRVPINIRTQGFDASYRQVGILTSVNGKEQILALMGRPLITNRDNWQYYTMSEKNNIKLPVSVKGKSCMNEYGCDKIYDGDSVYVEGYSNIFRATIYDNDVMRYLPFV